jgi:3-oxoacyl-(acyl-carrier-protein) synthase
MRERVFITGIGCISSFGVGHAKYGGALISGTSGIAPITAFDTSDCRSHLGGSVRDFDPAAFIAPLKLRRVDGVGRLVLASARLAVDDAAWPGSAGEGDSAGVALGTETAGIDSTVEYLQQLTKEGPAGAPALLFSNTVSNAPASLCAIELEFRGPNVTFNQREASALAALAYSVGLIRDRRVPAMLTGGADCLQETFFKVHDRFHALSPRTAGGAEAARPFDLRRNGYVLGEGAFTLLLESESSVARRGARPYGEILGVATTGSRTRVNDWPADPAGLSRAMRLALSDAGITRGEIDVIFAAANGSPQLDAIEAAAIQDVCDGRSVVVTSVKGAIGESGAGGAASAIAALVTLSQGQVPPAVGWSQPDPACGVNVSDRARSTPGTVFVVNSVASGGTNCSAVFRAARQHQEST